MTKVDRLYALSISNILISYNKRHSIMNSETTNEMAEYIFNNYSSPNSTIIFAISLIDGD
jgi:hypothetical protein